MITSFGTRGSQVQILPLRPAFLTIRMGWRPDMRDETRVGNYAGCQSGERVARR
jgi:hypothetical protein